MKKKWFRGDKWKKYTMVKLLSGVLKGYDLKRLITVCRLIAD